MTALLHAARAGQTDSVRALLAQGARSDLTDNNGRGALWLAVDTGRIEVLSTLISAGASVNTKTSPVSIANLNR